MIRKLVFCFILCLFHGQVYGHIPRSASYDYAEPNSPISVLPAIKATRTDSLDRLNALRSVLSSNGIDAYVIPTADAHNSQYIAPSDARREWISGMSGSAGTAVVTQTDALVWTDGRYYTQFYMQVDTRYWELMRTDNASISTWLTQNLNPGSVVGIDPTTYTRTSWLSLQAILSSANITLQATPDNLVDIARANINDPAPARPNEPLLALTVNYTGRVASEKISELLAQIRQSEASALVLTALDEVAYTLNIRGSDIPYNPVFFSYLILRADVATNNVILFWGNGTLSDDIRSHLSSENVNNLEVRPYEEIFEYLSNYSSALPSGSRIWLSQDGSHAIHTAAETNSNINILSTLSPVSLMKMVKNEVELAGFRNAHIKDGVAVVRFLRWVHEQVNAGYNVTEMDVSEKLEELRGEEYGFRGPSFETIAGAGENAAVIHYSPSREGEQRVIRPDDVLLVDSGAQYLDGTTDITRTRHMGTPTDMQRNTFTRVLKGQILMGISVFPEGTTGNILDAFARRYLWNAGLNYAHGTGHGVGHFLNVHEGPSGIGTGLGANDPGIQPGMIFSNEPGFYEVGEYGIRHEDLVEVIRMTRESDHIYASSLVGDFDGRGAVAFYTISLAPHQISFMDIELLNEEEITYLNDYHARVLATLGPILQERNLTDDYDWLLQECAPIARSTAAILKTTPLLVIMATVLWF